MKSVSYIENMETWREGFSFYIPIKIRFSETDMFGHVNNVSPFIYFEEARIEFLKSIGLFEDPKQGNGVPVVADLQCDYHQQIYFNDKIELYVKVSQIGNTSLDIHYMALNQKNEICLTGRDSMVYIDPTTGNRITLRESMKKRLTEENKQGSN